MQHFKQTPIILRVWENDFGIPSIDPECLQLMLLFRVSKVNVKFKQANFPLYRPIPSIECNTYVITQPDEILIQVQTLCHGAPDCNLLQEDIGRILAYKKYFIQKFIPAFFYDCWINPVNYEHTTRTWYIHAMMYPIGHLYATFKCMQAHERFHNMVGTRDSERVIMRLYIEAQNCLNDMATILSKDKRQFFLGQLPSTLDTLIYSYLAVALYLPLPEPYLQNLIKEHPILVEYVDRVTKFYFPEIKKTFKHVEPLNCTFETAGPKVLIIAGVCATAVMIAYGWNIGLVSSAWLPSLKDLSHVYSRFLYFLHKIKLPQLSV